MVGLYVVGGLVLVACVFILGALYGHAVAARAYNEFRKMQQEAEKLRGRG